jgi:predicted molibdopterin-dependent oxidoreductase YjgC
MVSAERVVETTCPYCGVGCQIDMHLSQDFIYRVSGRFDNQVNFGNLCVKGRFGFDFVHADDRLRTPLVRPDRQADFHPCDWDEALDAVAGRLLEIRARHGADSIAFLASAKCTNEENYLYQKLARAVVGTNNVDHCARL